MIRESEYFVYDGIDSRDFGIYNVTIGSGMFEEPFGAKREVVTTKIPGRDKPYFQRIDYDPLEFELTFAFYETWDEERIREVARWLTPSYWKPLYFSENEDRIFYCIPVDEPKLIHNGLKQGYITLKMLCDSPYSYSPVITSGIYDLSNNPVSGGTIIEVENHGDVTLKPEIWITKVGAGDVTIVNLSNADETFQFVNLVDNEEVYVHNESEHIETNIAGIYRYDNFNNNYLDLVRGVNRLQVFGNCKIQFRMQYKLLQG